MKASGHLHPGPPPTQKGAPGCRFADVRVRLDAAGRPRWRRPPSGRPLPSLPLRKVTAFAREADCAGVARDGPAHVRGRACSQAGRPQGIGAGKKRVLRGAGRGLQAARREIISIVGESVGQTTWARILLGLTGRPGEGPYRGRRARFARQGAPRLLAGLQAIYQDPFSTFNQFFRVERILSDCLKMQGLKRSARRKGESDAKPAGRQPEIR